uniref:Uncharacterized protein n=1 Tax=Anguilla anguilla TaxID=7936 RepID=A0A0E9QNJ4_ANGAN
MISGQLFNSRILPERKLSCFVSHKTFILLECENYIAFIRFSFTFMYGRGS